MPLTSKQVREQGFDRDAYPPCDRLGTWDAQVDAVVYSRGSRTGKYRKGSWAGIHLFLRALDDDRKHWLFAYLYTSSGVYHQAKELTAGDHIQVVVETAKSGHACVMSLNRLE